MFNTRFTGKGIMGGILDYLEDWLGLDDIVGEVELTEPESTSIEVSPLWSLFKFINKPNLVGLDYVVSDHRQYFTIPLGLLEKTGKYHYLIFPAGGASDEIKEISCHYNIASSTSAEEC